MSTTKPNLLAVATISPWPVIDGYSLRVYHLLRCLARDWDITLVAPQSDASGGAFPDALGDVRWFEMPWDPSWGFMPHQFDARELSRRVADAVLERPPQASLLWAGCEYLADELELPAPVLDKVDCGALTHWRASRNAAGLRASLSSMRAAWSYGRYERSAVRQARYTVVVGPDDARALTRLARRDTIRVVPNGVVSGREPTPGDEGPEPTVIFTGVMRYPPNVEAVTWFAESVWPAVRAKVPGARFVVAGRHPIDEITALDGRDGIVIRADVPDMAAELRPAWIGVAPMRSGSGIKNKVLEAWAEGKPVAMTTMAANGLQVDEDQERLVAADAGGLAATIVALLQDDMERRRLGRAAWEVATHRHGWPAAADMVTALLRDAMEQA